MRSCGAFANSGSSRYGLTRDQQAGNAEFHIWVFCLGNPWCARYCVADVVGERRAGPRVLCAPKAAGPLTLRRAIPISILVMLVALQGCGGSSGPAPGALQRLGALEDQLNLLVLPGYAEDGSGKAELDWVTPFERRSGCDVTSTVASSPGRVGRLMRSGRYDGVSARGDVGGALIADGLVDPVNTDLLPNYADVFPALKDHAANTVDGVTYGVSIGRTANLLIWKPAQVKRDPDELVSWDLIFDPELASRYQGGVAAPDDPMYIADAALYLREREPELEIENVFELDQNQFDAAIELLREQRRFIGRYWSDAAESARAFAGDAIVAGTGSLAAANRLRSEGVKVDAVVPKEGTTGLSDTWMLSSDARRPNCMYLWMDHVLGPEANAAIAVRTGQAPANERACNLIGAHCDNFRAADEDLFEDVEYWTTPLRDCGDDRGEVCMTYDEWARAYAELMRVPTVRPAYLRKP
jgi:putative spermidine/putrescine transport system substrate-binding protein